MVTLLARVVNHFRPREGWTPFLLSLAALLSPAAALLVAEADLDAGGVLVLAALAALAGLRFARSQVSGRAAAAWGALLGLAAAVAVIGRLLPPLSLLWRETTYAVAWLAQALRGAVPYPLPFAAAAGFVERQLTDLGVRLWWWGQTVASGGPAQDPIAFLLLAGGLAWAASFVGMWFIYRRRDPLAGLLPSGVGVAVVTFFGGGLSAFYLVVYLFCTLWLVAAGHLWRRQARWHETGTDYPEDLGLELVIALAPALTLVVILGAAFPVVRPRQIRDAFWEAVDRPWSAVEDLSERLFGPLPGSGEGDAVARERGTLPRDHLLGGGPELDETIALYVRTDDPPPPRPEPETPEAVTNPAPRRYWRSVTYDTYTGLGWTNGPLESRTTPAGEPLLANPPPGPELRQQFERVEATGGPLYAAKVPLRIDHAVETWWRGPEDLAFLGSPAGRYTVVSQPPAWTVADLRAAPPTLPPPVAERYLVLPETVPARVLDLAREVAGEAGSRYDQAWAIETYLRTYTYTLDLPEPPTDRDLVDYFLFERQEGYCDYYASAMVVMARAVGIPARLASGYAQGAYDHEAGRWVVTERESHSWAEVYFDGVGWVEFEPTAGQPGLVRATGEVEPSPAVPPLPPRARLWWQQIPWGLLGLGGVLLLAAAVLFFVWRPRAAADVAAADLIRDRQARLLKWGARLGQPFRDGQTPHEYGAALGDALRGRGRAARWPPVQQAAEEAPAEVERLAESFVRTQYSPEPPSDREGWRVRDLWTRLRRRLWWLWLGRK